LFAINGQRLVIATAWIGRGTIRRVGDECAVGRRGLGGWARRSTLAALRITSSAKPKNSREYANERGIRSLTPKK